MIIHKKKMIYEMYKNRVGNWLPTHLNLVAWLPPLKTKDDNAIIMHSFKTQFKYLNSRILLYIVI